MNNTIFEICDYLKFHDNYYIIVHKNPDGDCLGSAKALCLVLRNSGKNAKICLPNDVSHRLSFIWDDSLVHGDFKCDTALCVDVASIGQMGDLYESVYKSAPNSLCIDHHGTNEGYADLNLIRPDSAAAGEIIFDIINTLGMDLTAVMAESLLVSLADDTGSFQYSNTTSDTHRIVSELYKVIPEPEPIMRALYGTHTRCEMDVLKAIMPSLEYSFDGKVCSIMADISAIKAMGADPSNVDAWVGLPRSVKGVEAALIFKCISSDETKVSFRSNDYVDVSALAAKFGGGGHVRAAGATFYEGYESARNKIFKELEKLV